MSMRHELKGFKAKADLKKKKDNIFYCWLGLSLIVESRLTYLGEVKKSVVRSLK